MGMLRGSAAMVRFRVEGTPPQPFWEVAAEQIQAHAFQDIDEGLDEYSAGWTAVDDMLATDFSRIPYVVGDYLVLGLRVDERKVPAAVLRKYCLKEERRILAERGLPRLGRQARAEIRDRVHAELARKAPPVPSCYELAWSLARNVVYFFSTSKKGMAVCEELFYETFGVRLVLEIPYLAAERFLDDEGRRRLAALQPAVLA